MCSTGLDSYAIVDWTAGRQRQRRRRTGPGGPLTVAQTGPIGPLRWEAAATTSTGAAPERSTGAAPERSTGAAPERSMDAAASGAGKLLRSGSARAASITQRSERMRDTKNSADRRAEREGN